MLDVVMNRPNEQADHCLLSASEVRTVYYIMYATCSGFRFLGFSFNETRFVVTEYVYIIPKNV